MQAFGYAIEEGRDNAINQEDEPAKEEDESVEQEDEQKSESEKITSLNTGDTSHILMYVLVAIISFGGIYYCCKRIKENK